MKKKGLTSMPNMKKLASVLVDEFMQELNASHGLKRGGIQIPSARLHPMLVELVARAAVVRSAPAINAAKRILKALDNAIGANEEVARCRRRNMSAKAIAAREQIADAAARGLVKVLTEQREFIR